MRTFLNLCFPILFIGFLACVDSGNSDASRQTAEATSKPILAKAEPSPKLEKGTTTKKASLAKNKQKKESLEPSKSNGSKKVFPKGKLENKETKPSISTVAKKGKTSPKKPPLPKPQPKSSKIIPDHTSWDYLLRTFVSDAGKVNYAGIKTKKQFLDNYLKDLKNKPPQKDWSRNEKLAYWINAYNAFTVKLILDNYPVSSITDLHGGKAWDVKWIELGDKKYSLNNIENDILRSKFKEPRIHFAVNCAANSCPPLLNKAWTPNSLEGYFEQRARAFINNPKFNKINSNKVQVSKIFEWYAGDFGNLIAFLNKYSKTKINANAQVSFLDYDWALNKK